MNQWFRRRRKPEDNPEVKNAMQKRDEVLAEALEAVHEVDRQQAEIIAEYAEADRQRLRGKKR